MLDTNPRPYIIAGGAIIIFFFGGLFAWSAFLPFYGAVIAPAIVKVEGNKKIVQHLEGGIVDKVLVKEGDVVKKGQVLIILKDEKIHASISLYQGRLYSKLAEAARLRAESLMKDKIEWPKELLENKDTQEAKKAMQEEEEIFLSRRSDLMGKISLLESQIKQLKRQKQGVAAQLKAQEEILLALEDELSAKEDLFKQKFLDKAQILELRRRVAEVKGSLESLKQREAELAQKIEEFKLRIVDLKNTYKEGAVSKLSEVNDEIFSLRQQLKPLLDAKERLKIKAPIDGEVINLRVHSEDTRVIRPGEPLMEIVPKDSEMIVEARIRPDEITKVYKGQKAKVQLTAFDRRSTPPVPGEVTYVSADQISQQTSRGVQSFYIAHVKVDEKRLKEIGAYLYPGMPAVCYMTTKKRTILDYLLEPILKVTDQALRE
jgi:HlyD family type I secretion membrane fusion protein